MSEIEYTAKSRKAFIIKISGTEDKMLKENEIMIGWSKVSGLLKEGLTKKDFRELIQKQYFPKETSKRRSGQIAGDMWRFIREIAIGNFVLIPAEKGFFIGRVSSLASYNEMKIFNDTAYRRKVEWLNNKNPIPLEKTPPELQKRLKTIQSVIDASDLYQEIEFTLRIA